MSFLKSIAVSYLALYLVLPGCLCQLLGVFGWDIHSHSQSSGEQPFVITAAAENSPPCHCDTIDPKDCDVPPAQAEATQPDLPSAPLYATLLPAEKETDVTLFAPSRAPPGRPFWSLSTHSGVFLV